MLHFNYCWSIVTKLQPWTVSNSSDIFTLFIMLIIASSLFILLILFSYKQGSKFCSTYFILFKVCCTKSGLCAAYFEQNEIHIYIDGYWPVSIYIYIYYMYLCTGQIIAMSLYCTYNYVPKSAKLVFVFKSHMIKEPLTYYRVINRCLLLQSHVMIYK